MIDNQIPGRQLPYNIDTIFMDFYTPHARVDHYIVYMLRLDYNRVESSSRSLPITNIYNPLTITQWASWGL